MAVNKIKKLSVICASNEVDEIINRLLWLSCVDVEAQRGIEIESLEWEKFTDVESKLAEKNKQITALEGVMRLLDGFDRRKWSKYGSVAPKKGLFSPPEVVDVGDFVTSGRYELAVRKLSKLNYLANQLKTKEEGLKRLEDETKLLKAWLKYERPLGIQSTEYTDITLGTLPKRTDTCRLKELLSDGLMAHLERVGADDSGVYACLISLKEHTPEALKLLNQHGFLIADFQSRTDTAVRELENVKRSITQVQAEIRKVNERIADMLGSETDLKTLYDILKTDIVKLNVKKKLYKTGAVCIIDGFLPESATQRVEETMQEFMCAYDISDTEEGEAPILLSNNTFASAFEPVVELYSMPKYRTFDPTMIMSIFYVIIFGLMFADVGYGIILTLGCVLARRLLYPQGTMKKFFEMFAYCGISCIVCGILMGGYFGDLPQSVLGLNFSLALWFDPTEDPMTFLYLSLIVGGAHLVTGMIIKMVVLIKDKKIVSAIFDVGSWLVVFVGIATMLLSLKVGLIIAGVGVLMLILTQGRHEKNFFMKIIKGIGSLYSITNYASDLLSYTRILALGLASAVIAKVVNLIATLGGQSIVGYILLIVVLLVGHMLNLAINLLGTFIHTSRLQYIEFFGKFYEDGGTPFVVLAPRSKYVILKNRRKSK
ncbi:MAG: V-type ATP synthase subunit I [Clostridia bacterium]|nr:V-type ATP synthase subunit I [Clostridia bacterium]